MNSTNDNIFPYIYISFFSYITQGIVEQIKKIHMFTFSLDFITLSREKKWFNFHMLLDKVYILFNYNIHFEGVSPEGALTSVIYRV